MKKKWFRLSYRLWVIVLIVLVAFAGAVGIYRTFINPSYLKIHGVKVSRKKAIQAYFALHPEASPKTRVSHKNAIEAFMIRQAQYDAYLQGTQNQWFQGLVLDRQEGTVTDEDAHVSHKVVRCVIETNTRLLSVYFQDEPCPISVGDTVEVKLGSEFSELTNFNDVVYKGKKIKIDFSSRVIQFSILPTETD